MKRILSAVLVLSLGVSIASAKDSNGDLVKSSNNKRFSDSIKALGYGNCVENTYGAYVTAQDNGSPYSLDFALARKLTLNVTKSKNVFTLIKVIDNAPYSFTQIIKIKEKGGAFKKEARKSNYVDGYVLTEFCDLK